MRDRLVKQMLSRRKDWLGLLATFAALAATAIAGAQDFGTFQGNSARTGKTANSFTYGPGIANLTWFWPNGAGNVIGGVGVPLTSIRDNNSNAVVRNPNLAA